MYAAFCKAAAAAPRPSARARAFSAQAAAVPAAAHQRANNMVRGIGTLAGDAQRVACCRRHRRRLAAPTEPQPNASLPHRLFLPPHALLAPLQLPFGRAAVELSADDLVVPSFPLPASNREQAPCIQATAPRCYASGAGEFWSAAGTRTDVNAGVAAAFRGLTPDEVEGVVRAHCPRLLAAVAAATGDARASPAAAAPSLRRLSAKFGTLLRLVAPGGTSAAAQPFAGLPALLGEQRGEAGPRGEAIDINNQQRCMPIKATQHMRSCITASPLPPLFYCQTPAPPPPTAWPLPAPIVQPLWLPRPACACCRTSPLAAASTQLPTSPPPSPSSWPPLPPWRPARR